MQEILSNLGFDWQVALVNLLNFFIIFWILKRFAFKPINKILDERKEKIQAGINQAQKTETELLVAQQKADEEIKQARVQANQIILEATKNKESIIAQAQTEAQTEASKIIKKTHTALEQEKESLGKEMSQKTAELVALGVQKILEEEMTPERSKELSLKALGALNK